MTEVTFNFDLVNDIEAIAKTITEDVTSNISIEMGKAMRSSPATGRRYGSHTASSPGNAPRINTGGLISSIDISFPSERTGKVEVDGIGRYLDEGTIFIEPRGFVEPAIDVALSNVLG